MRQPEPAPGDANIVTIAGIRPVSCSPSSAPSNGLSAAQGIRLSRPRRDVLPARPRSQNTVEESVMHIDWASFTPWSAVMGGVIIGVAAAMLALVNGRIAGISGIVGGLFRPSANDLGWRVAFLAGLVAAPILYAMAAALPAIVVDANYPTLIAAGLL